MTPLRKIGSIAAIGRTIDSVAAALSNPTSHRFLKPATYSTNVPSNPCSEPHQFFSRAVSYSHGSVKSFSTASTASSSFAENVSARELQPPVSYLPKEVVLFQYEACPFCNKVKAFLDYYSFQYKIVEVNPINKKEIKWSDYKKVPILVVDGEQMNESSAIIDKLFEKVHPTLTVESLPDADEVKKWRGWVDNHLVHLLSPNIYRTTSEALESFDYITTHVARYTGAAAMYFVSKKLKKKHNITDERAALYEAAETWVDALKGRPCLGGTNPNLADLAVFGVLRPIRHLKSGKDMVEHTRIGEWYSRMESEMQSKRQSHQAE